MRLFTNLLFTEGSRRRVFDLRESSDRFGPIYGNRVANERALHERWDPDRDVLCDAEGADTRTPVGCG